MHNDIVWGGYLLDGWHGLESWNGVLTRWMGKEAHIRTDGAKELKLNFKVLSFNKPRILEICEIRREIPTNFVDISMLLDDDKIITLRSPNGSDEPRKVNGSDDRRELSFAFQAIAISKT